MFSIRLVFQRLPGPAGVLAVLLWSIVGLALPVSGQDAEVAERVRITIAVVENHRFDDASVVVVMNPDGMPGTTALLSIERDALTATNLQEGVESIGRVLSRMPERESEGPLILKVATLGSERPGRRVDLPAVLAARVAEWPALLTAQIQELSRRGAARGVRAVPPPPPLAFLGAEQVVGLMHLTLRKDAWQP